MRKLVGSLSNLDMSLQTHMNTKSSSETNRITSVFSLFLLGRNDSETPGHQKDGENKCASLSLNCTSHSITTINSFSIPFCVSPFHCFAICFMSHRSTDALTFRFSPLSIFQTIFRLIYLVHRSKSPLIQSTFIISVYLPHGTPHH